jgi:type III secretory pathway component EscU
MHVWFPVKKSLFRIAGISYFNTTVMSLILVFAIYMIFYAIALCFIMFIWPFVGPLIWINKILSYLITGVSECSFKKCGKVRELKHFSRMRFSKGFEYLPVSIFNLWLLILNLVKDFLWLKSDKIWR